MAVRRHSLLWSLVIWSVLLVANLGLAAQGDLSYKVYAMVIDAPSGKWAKQGVAESTPAWKLLTVRRTKVILSDGVGGASVLNTQCSDFLARTTIAREVHLAWRDEHKKGETGHFLDFGNAQNTQHIQILIQVEGVNGVAALRQIRDACATQQAEEPHLLQLEREEAERQRAEAERQRKEADAAWQAEVEAKRKLHEEETRQIAQQREEARLTFAKSVLAALRFADEPDPFASVRGDFDLSASDSHQWKTSLQLAGADKCALLKAPPATPASPSAWTFGCMFRASSDGYNYEGMVKSVKSILDLDYQPDEKATGINQVFFADPARPSRRVFVAKINEATIGVSVVVVRSAGAPADFNAAPFSTVPTMLHTEPTIHDEVEAIHSLPHGAMPPAQRSTAAPAMSGRTTMTVKNSTAYELSVFFDGPVSQKLTLAPGASQDLDLAPGTFHVAGRVAASDVLPFYGEETYAGSARYSVTFYIGGR